MKLPNFYDFEPLNNLKQRMGISRHEYGQLEVEIAPPRLSLETLEELEKKGRDVSYSELEFLPNGTVAYNGIQVLVYIRDRSEFADMPKFHFASCTTLVWMNSIQKIDKFVVATRSDGLFDMNITGIGRPRSKQAQLQVCKNCLHHLSYDGYSHQVAANVKQRIVTEFSIPLFFQKYRTTLIEKKPRFNSDNAPVNDYSKDWNEISLHYRKGVKWKCENPNCGRVLGQPDLRQYLHTHHKNGLKYDNGTANLVALCIECHAAQPDHAHMKASPQYAAFAALNI